MKVNRLNVYTFQQHRLLPMNALALIACLVAVTAATSAYQREPLWKQMWHLHDASEADEYWIRAGLVPDHLGVHTVWTKFNITGRGVRIAIVDDGVDVAHPEFSTVYSQALAWDYNDDDPNPSPRVHDSHGTESAGVATGHLNGVCGLGTAPGSILVPVRLIASPVSDLVEAEGLAHHSNVVDIYSNSWGPPDDGLHLDAPGPLTAAAMYQTVSQGRGGRGGIYVWAGGNGRQWLDSCSYDGFANSRLVITVAAVGYLDTATYYGEWCPSILVAAPSSSASGPEDKQRIATTQPHGVYGTSPGDCSADFGGTSASAPMVAGIVALMLEARPALGWRDVHHILALTARKNDPDHVTWHTNGAGHDYSMAYGFGVVNATAAVERSLVWSLLGPERYVSVRTPSDFFASPLDAVLAPPVRIELVVGPEQAGLVEFVELYVTIEHPRRGDLEVVLLSPAGTRSELASAHSDTGANYDRWRFGSRAPFGESSVGTWVLLVRDVIPNRISGTIYEAELRAWLYDEP